MNIKSLLLGSAAVLVAATGARAADAIVIAEPEPVEYVRVCDTYGAGYFYIPGTETCMRIHGYVRAEATAGDNVYATRLSKEIRVRNTAAPYAYTGVRISSGVDNTIDERDTYDWMTRAAVRFSTASETELGTLRTYIDTRFQWADGRDAGSTGTLRNAWIELGGFRVGMGDTSFVSWTNSYGTVWNDDVITQLGKRTNFLSYTFNAGNGLSAMIALEQGNNQADGNGVAYRDAATGILAIGASANLNDRAYGGFYDFRRSGVALDNRKYVNNYGGIATADHYAKVKRLGSQIDDYMPNVVGGVKYEQGWGGFSAVIAYDSFNEEWAGKARVDVNATDDLSLFAMIGYKSNDDAYLIDASYGTNSTNGYNYINNTYGVYRVNNSIYGDWGGDWAIWTGGQYRFNEDRTAFNLQLSYDDTRTFNVAANIEHEIVSGLSLVAELDYTKWNDKVGFDALYDATGTLLSSGIRSSLKGKDAFSGTVVLQRSF